MNRIFVVALAIVLFAGNAVADDVAGSEDHPILTRYPGSTIQWHDIQNFSPYKIATGPVTGYRKIDDWVETQGRLTRIYYVLDGERTHGEVYENYRKALLDNGFDLLADGFFADGSRSPEVGSRKWFEPYFAENPLPPGEGIELLAGSSTSGGSAFLAATRDRAGGPVFVAITITQQRADRVTYLIDVVEVDDVETDLVVIDAEAIGRDIGDYGRVTLTGLQFDHDKATLKSESKPALDEIAKFLAANAAMNFFIVGHTDSTGGFEYNRSLSEERAAAVRQALVNDYGVAGERLEAHGVGPLSPIFTNRMDRGREQNRRVELVER